MNKNLIIAVVVILVLGAGGYYYMMQKDEAVIEKSSDETTLAESGETMMEGEVKEFVVSGADFAFAPERITVKKGNTVRIVFNNTDASMPHDWKLDEFNAATAVLQPGESETIEFVASQTGTFEYYCSVGQHRANGMVGNLVVE